MRSIRSVGSFLVVGSVLCGIMAYERYETARQTGQAVADSIEGVDFVSVGIPIESKVAAFLGVVLLVAGVCCLHQAFFGHREQT